MKKGLCLLLCFVAILAFSACDNAIKEPENSLLADLQISGEHIAYILITDEQMEEIKITNPDDFSFLVDYTYQSEFPEDRLHELYLFPNAKNLTVCCADGNTAQVTVMEDGSIVTGVGTEGPYKMYTSDTLEKANRQFLGALLKKYGGYFDESKD